MPIDLSQLGLFSAQLFWHLFDVTSQGHQRPQAGSILARVMLRSRQIVSNPNGLESTENRLAVIDQPLKQHAGFSVTPLLELIVRSAPHERDLVGFASARPARARGRSAWSGRDSGRKYQGVDGKHLGCPLITISTGGASIPVAQIAQGPLFT
jgi:hypothetical protein